MGGASVARADGGDALVAAAVGRGARQPRDEAVPAPARQLLS